MSDILLLVALAALFVGAAFGVLLTGLVQTWHDRRTLAQLGRRDGAA